MATPEGPHKTGQLQKSINSLRGKIALLESTSGGFGDRLAAPASDWKAQRLGPDFTAAEVELRKAVEASVFAVFGCSGLLGNLENSGQREAYRRYQRSTLESLAAIASVEFSRIIDADVTFDFERLRASDTAGQARAFRFLVGKSAKLDQKRALRLSGLTPAGLDPE